MKTPEEKYNNDPHYRMLVDYLSQFIHKGEYTPSELREACIYAAIRYERMRIAPMMFVTSEVNEAIEVLDKWATGRERKR